MENRDENLELSLRLKYILMFDKNPTGVIRDFQRGHIFSGVCNNSIDKRAA